jgi:hypothetical protein
MDALVVYRLRNGFLFPRMRCGDDVDVTTKIGYMIFQPFCVRKITNYYSTFIRNFGAMKWKSIKSADGKC